VDESDRLFYEELELRQIRWTLEDMATKRTLFKRDDKCEFDFIVVVHRFLGTGRLASSAMTLPPREQLSVSEISCSEPYNEAR
jgi:hypothetical protein